MRWEERKAYTMAREFSILKHGGLGVDLVDFPFLEWLI